VEVTLGRVLDWREALREGRDFHYAVLDRTNHSLLGALGIHPRVGPQGLELGYWLRPSATGLGLATEAAAAATRVALELMGAHRVELHIDSRNAASVRLAERLGFRLEARLREWGADLEGARGDRLIFGLLSRELAGSPAAAVRLRARGTAGEVLLDDLT
jgi:RimJ/RimL family protein N-acetyltransferase